ncbi:MAG: hypothetical protein JWM05_3675, partial [Acidimicrobiales bacterium]|nr:hypothetical protein [Acidimicrobiales bacterium]
KLVHHIETNTDYREPKVRHVKPSTGQEQRAEHTKTGGG